MDDSIQLSIGEQIAAQLLANKTEISTEQMSPKTKELVVKDSFRFWIKDVQANLNEVFPDVKFRLMLCAIMPYQDVHYGAYDRKWASDDDYVDPVSFEDSDDPDEIAYYRLDLSQVGLEFEYTLIQECSLGHKHYRKRYHLFSTAQWFRMIASWYAGLTGREFVKEYINDFFYEI